MAGKNTSTHPNNAYVVSVQLDRVTYNALEEIRLYTGRKMSDVLKTIICKATYAYTKQLIPKMKQAAEEVMNAHIILDEELWRECNERKTGSETGSETD